MHKPEPCRPRQERPLYQALCFEVIPPGPLPATAVPVEQDQEDVTPQNLYSPFWKVLQVLEILEFYSQMAPSLLSGFLWTTCLDISPWGQALLPECTFLGPKDDYAWGYSLSEQAGVSTFVCARPTHNVGRSQGGRDNIHSCGIWACLCALGLGPEFLGVDLPYTYTIPPQSTNLELYKFVSHKITHFNSRDLIFNQGLCSWNNLFMNLVGWQ